MLEAISKITTRNREGVSAALPRMAAAFAAGMIVMAFLAYVPLIVDIFSHNSSQDSAVPAPSYAPEPLDPTGIPDGSYAVKQNMRAPVYIPF